MTSERETGFYYVQFTPDNFDTVEINWDVRLVHSIAFYARFNNPKMPGGREEHMRFAAEPVRVPNDFKQLEEQDEKHNDN